DRYEDAIAFYRRALDDEGDPAMLAEVRLRLAECLAELGRVEEARERLKEFWPDREAFADGIGDVERIEWARRKHKEWGLEAR
ncbi:MAG: tetratricopeptide repeat protein, partial [Acidobacteriota bacterium]|nr:tetratricopeptide repeat protein [Acidobacteriota bacterium]